MLISIINETKNIMNYSFTPSKANFISVTHRKKRGSPHHSAGVFGKRRKAWFGKSKKIYLTISSLLLYNSAMKKYFKYKLQNLINVSEVVALHYLEFGKNFKTKGESHDFWELVYAEKESLICTADGREIPLMQGEILFHRPGEFHTLAANGQTAPSAFVLCFVCRSDAMAFFENRKLRLEKRLVKLLYSIWEEGKRMGI